MRLWSSWEGEGMRATRTDAMTKLPMAWQRYLDSLLRDSIDDIKAAQHSIIGDKAGSIARAAQEKDSRTLSA